MPGTLGSLIGARLRLVQDAFDNERWASLHLVVDVSKVRPDDAQADQLHSTKEQDEDDQRGEAARHTRRIDQPDDDLRSEEHTSELQSHLNLVCRLLLEKKKE